MEMLSKLEQTSKPTPRVNSSFGDYKDTATPTKQGDIITHGNSSTAKNVGTPANLGLEEEKALIE